MNSQTPENPSATTTRHLYFAYGSNLDPDQMDRRCPDAIAIGAASLADHAFRIGARGYATVSPSPGDTVWGGVWDVSVSDLARLDTYEGVASGMYRRETALVDVDGQSVATLIYIEEADDVGSPSDWYLDRVVAGARWFELPDSYAIDLESWAA
jgi:gamma-glutamylcyclotransferase (GGCT)/AIG2-like uncharacterized protein YtfP